MIVMEQWKKFAHKKQVGKMKNTITNETDIKRVSIKKEPNTLRISRGFFIELYISCLNTLRFE